MAILGIDFQDGFHNDVLVVRIDDQEVYRQASVTTQLLLGLADSFQTEIEPGLAHVEIQVETRDLTRAIPLDASADTYLGISIVNGQLVTTPPRDEPFGYA